LHNVNQITAPPPYFVTPSLAHPVTPSRFHRREPRHAF
jgi:hypothetical protein